MYDGTEEAKLHIFGSQCKAEVRKRNQIFGSPSRDEVRKWTYPYLEVLVEQVRKTIEIFRSPVRAEVWKAELQFFGSKDRVGLQRRSFRPLKVMAERKCGS